jgi:uncharacterized membrane protein SpoIIM required for sporulation
MLEAILIACAAAMLLNWGITSYLENRTHREIEGLRQTRAQSHKPLL